MTDENYTVANSERIGDSLIIMVKLLLYTPALALILAVLVVVIARPQGDSAALEELVSQVFVWSLLPAAWAALVLACRARCWRIVLEAGGLRMSGPCWRRRLTYEDLRLLRLDGAMPLSKADDAPSGGPLRIAPHVGRELRIYLAPDAARALFDTLRARSPQAAAIGPDGTAYPARVDVDGDAGRRLRWTLRRRGAVLAAVGVFLLVMAAFGEAAPSDTLDVLHDIMLRGLAISGGLAMLAFGFRLLGQSAAMGRRQR